MDKESNTSTFDIIPPHLIIDDFLGGEVIDALLQHVISNEGNFVDTSVSTGKNDNSNHVDVNWRISRVLQDFGSLKKNIKQKFIDVLPIAIQKLRTDEFNLEWLELELVAHGDKAFYKTHIDTSTNRNAETVRVITAVYYFHSQPKVFFGGQLRILPLRHNVPDSKFLDVEPINDRLLLFPSWVPHQVLPVKLEANNFIDSRFAINCWYRKKKS